MCLLFAVILIAFRLKFVYGRFAIILCTQTDHFESGENYDQSPLLYLHVNFNFEDNHLPFIPSTFLYPDMFDLSPMHRT